MHKNKILILAIILTFFLIKCQQNIKKDDKKIGGEITFLCMPNGPQRPHVQWLSQLAGIFKQKYGTKVNIQIVDWRYAFQKINRCVTTGSGADVVQVGCTWQGMFAAADGLAPIDDIVQEMGGEKAFVKPLLDSCKYKGVYFGLPWFAETRCLVYNKKIFRKLSLKPPRTYKELMNTGQKIIASEGTGSAIVITGYKAWDLLHNYATILWSNGGKLFSNDYRKSKINSKIAVKSMLYYIDLIREGLASKKCAEYNTPQANQAFGKGRAAMIFMNTGDIAFLDMDYPYIEYGVVPPPEGLVKRASFAGGSNISIIKGSKNMAAAKAWVRFLASAGIQASYCKYITKMQPGTLAAYNDPYFRDSSIQQTFKEVLVNGTSYPVLKSWLEIENIMLKAYRSILWIYINNNEVKQDSVEKLLNMAKYNIDLHLFLEK